jgi:hypothetical protein
MAPEQVLLSIMLLSFCTKYKEHDATSAKVASLFGLVRFIYLLTHVLTYLLSYVLTYLFTYSRTY